MPKIEQQRFRAVMPAATHRREASCEEVDCPHYLNGWKTIVGKDSQQALYIRKESEREFTEMIEGSMVTFIFPPGQTCFRPHSFPTGRAPLYLRERPGQKFIHKRGEDWLEDLAGTLEQAGRLERKEASLG